MTEIDYTKWEYPESDLAVLEEMNGYVCEIDDETKTFWVLCDEGDQFEIPSHTLPLNERPYLIEGAFCRWRFYKDPDYDDEVIEEFIFNKHEWSKEEIQEAERKSKELDDLLD